MDLGAERQLSGVTLVNDHRRAPAGRAGRVVESAGGRIAARRRAQAPGRRAALGERRASDRSQPDADRALRAGERPPGPARRDRAQKGRWSVAELFLLGPPAAGAAPDATATLIPEGQRLEDAGQTGPALLRYHEAMRRAPDDPAGYEAFARLSTALRASTSLRSSTPDGSRNSASSPKRGLLYTDVTRALGTGPGPRGALAGSGPPRGRGRRPPGGEPVWPHGRRRHSRRSGRSAR